jgi:hypothetical protein
VVEETEVFSLQMVLMQQPILAVAAVAVDNKFLHQTQEPTAAQAVQVL